MAAGASDLPAKSPEGETSVEASLCHNCGAVAPGNFCSMCGQTTHVHMPTLFEFLHEFISHHVALEGTLVASLKRLLFSPGRLTLDYYQGKRARYVAPLRLYLTFNVIFFLAVSLFQTIGLGSISQDADARNAVAQAKFSDATAAIDEATKEIMADPELTPEQRQAAAQKLATLQQYAARAALPDTLQKGSGAAPSSGDGASTSSGTPAAAAAPSSKDTASVSSGAAAVKAKPEKTYNFTFGKPPAGATSSGALSSGNATSSDATSASGSFAIAPGKDEDDDDDDAAALRDVRKNVHDEVLESARDAAEAVAPDAKPLAKTSGTPNINISRVPNSTVPAWVDRYAPIVHRRIDELSKRSSEENLEHLKQNSLHYAPYTLLALLPVCAFLLQMSFIGRHRGYVEHLVATLHGHTFLFIVLLVFVPINAYSGKLGALWMLLALVHMVWALSRIYGSRGIGLFMRLSVLAVTYGIALVFATSFAVLISVLT